MGLVAFPVGEVLPTGAGTCEPLAPVHAPPAEETNTFDRLLCLQATSPPSTGHTRWRSRRPPCGRREGAEPVIDASIADCPCPC